MDGGAGAAAATTAATPTASTCTSGTHTGEPCSHSSNLQCEACPTGRVGLNGTCGVACTEGTGPNAARIDCGDCVSGKYSNAATGFDCVPWTPCNEGGGMGT